MDTFFSRLASSNRRLENRRHQGLPRRVASHFVKLIYFGGIIDPGRHRSIRCSPGSQLVASMTRHHAGAALPRSHDRPAISATWATRLITTTVAGYYIILRRLGLCWRRSRHPVLLTRGRKSRWPRTTDPLVLDLVEWIAPGAAALFRGKSRAGAPQCPAADDLGGCGSTAVLLRARRLREPACG